MTTLTEDRAARIAWAHIAEPLDENAHDLTSRHGHAEALNIVRRDPTTHPTYAARLADLDLAAYHQAMRTANARAIIPGDAEWPTQLDDLPTPPHTLFATGTANVADTCARAVAIVGARAATHYGTSTANRLAAELSENGVAIVSGGAFGIDAAAHKGAFTTNTPTVCVAAGGLDRLYPHANANLFTVICERGVIVTEMPPGFGPMRQRFLNRNRIIAALSQATIVVESGMRSGTLNTARHAATLTRPVGAVPGPVTSVTSTGCHELIRSGAATLVTNADDVLALTTR